MIGNYIGKPSRPTYLVKMTAEEMAFYRLTEKAWRLPEILCSSATQTAILVSNKMRELSLPVWCLKDVDAFGVYDVVQQYIEFVQKEGYEAHVKAVEIGRIASSKPSLAGNLFTLLTSENCQRGMREYLRYFENGRIRNLLLKLVQRII